MEYELSAEEVRVLGALMEKEMTTPEYYPMTANGLKNACNQKSNRNPVVDYDETEVKSTLDKLRFKMLTKIVDTAGKRARKYKHQLRDVLLLDQKEAAAICMLMLRGPQTIGEIRNRTERMVTFDDLADVEETLTDLCADERKPKTLVVKLPTQPGQKEPRFMHLLSGEPDLSEFTFASPPPTENSSSKVHQLEEKITALTAEVAELKQAFETFKQQFD